MSLSILAAEEGGSAVEFPPIENVVEWWFAVPMVLAFLAIALLFRRTGFHLRGRFS